MNTENQINNDERTIAPAQITLNVATETSTSAKHQSSPWFQHRYLFLGLIIAVIAMVAVVFVLPNKIIDTQNNTPSQIDSGALTDNDGAAENSTSLGTNTSKSGPNESPWQDAQFAKERRETQDVLAIMLDRQSRLEKIKVELWAMDEYNQAQQLAVEADQQYSQQNFLQSSQLYQQSLNKLDTLLENSDGVFEAAIVDGNSAILAGDQQTAEKSFQLAGHIKPDSPEAAQGLERTAVLQEVLDKINQGKASERNKQLAAAQQYYQQALALDSQSAIAKENLTRINQNIVDEKFRKAMSTGFSAIANKNYNTATKAFNEALTIKPNAKDARDALNQAQNHSTEITIQNHIENGEKHEAKEEWPQAVAEYESAQALDNNLVEVKIGLIRARTFAGFDRKMSDILNKPERLTSAKVHREYQVFLDEAKNVKNPGDRLQKQTAKLELELQYALEPVTVSFVSDSQTDITLYQVTKLGKFATTELTLQPGTYTIVGTRQGYRDVRTNFVVSAKKDQTTTVTISCIEKISKG